MEAESSHSYYDSRYFARQRMVGEFGGTAELFKFRRFIKPPDKVIDFGCGGGYLLKNIVCTEKIGIEVNDAAREQASKLAIATVASVAEVPDSFADVVVSNHALEHVTCPFEVVASLRPKTKTDGIFVCVVPHQGPKECYREADVNQHLYTWNPLTLGNLFRSAGYSIIEVQTIRSKWPPWYQRIWAWCGETGFHWISRLYAILRNDYQIRIVAKNG
jgi:SAM-dependent methyltransferase